MIPSRLPPSSGVGQPTIGRPFYGQAKGLLSPAGRQPFERSEVGLFSDGRKPGCMVFAAKGGIRNGARKGAHLASAAVLYTSRGRSPQPVREASADPGQNPWRPGPKARRRHQPSPAKAGVNLREYWKAPLRSRSRSRSRPRHRRLNLQAPQGLVPFCVIFLLHI